MDSFHAISVEDASDELINFIENHEPLPETLCPSAYEWIELNQALDDCRQLYSMFIWNCDRYHEGVAASASDSVITNASGVGPSDVFERKWLDINCYTSN